MRVLLVTSDREQCGIKEYSNMLKEYSSADVEFWERNESPDWVAHEVRDTRGRYDVLHLNHHAALHAAWKPEHITEIQAFLPVVVTQHDTFEKLSIMLERGFPDFRGADALVVHEPVEGLTHPQGVTNVADWWAPRVRYLRQGVPTQEGLPSCKNTPPIAGTFGFPFGFKNVDTLCRATAAAGWGIRIIAPGATVEQCEEWQRLNPDADVWTIYMDRREVVAQLAECDANIFHSVSGNSGTTGPIRLALAAGRPIISTGPSVNRQIRDLADEDGIIWADSESWLAYWLSRLGDEPVTTSAYKIMIKALAAKDSWENLARAYAGIYEGVMR